MYRLHRQFFLPLRINVVHHDPKFLPGIRSDRDPPSPIWPRRRRVAAKYIQRLVTLATTRAEHLVLRRMKRVIPMDRDQVCVVVISHQQRSRFWLPLKRPSLFDTNKTKTPQESASLSRPKPIHPAAPSATATTDSSRANSRHTQAVGQNHSFQRPLFVSP